MENSAFVRDDEEISKSLTDLRDKSSFIVNNEPLNIHQSFEENSKQTPLESRLKFPPKKSNRISPVEKEGATKVEQSTDLSLEDSFQSPTSRKEKEIKDRPPLKYCVFIAKFPLLAFFLTSIFHISVLGSTAYLVLKGYDVFPINFEELPLILHNDISRTRDLAFRERNDFDNYVRRRVSGIRVPTYFNGYVKDVIEVLLETSNSQSIFSKENLQLIREVEDRLWNMKHFRLLFCYRKDRFTCERPMSVLQFFDGTHQNKSSLFYDPNFTNINQVLCEAYNNTDTKNEAKFYFVKNYNPCLSNSIPTQTRIVLKLGYPLVGFAEQERIETYLNSIVRTELENIRDVLLKDKIDLYYLTQLLFNYDVTRQAIKDMLLTLGSFCFIFVFMWIQTRSLWITFMGILSIITSFLMTNLIYRFVLGYKYFGLFHIVSMFIILGIGADDVFIFYDTWRLTENYVYLSNAHRLSDCYKRAAKTTLVTSLTTMAAFLVSGMSPLLPVSSFGIFSGILVGVNYLCDLLYFPTVIMVHSSRIMPLLQKMKTCLICCRKKEKEDTRFEDRSSSRASSGTFRSMDDEIPVLKHQLRPPLRAEYHSNHNNTNEDISKYFNQSDAQAPPVNPAPPLLHMFNRNQETPKKPLETRVTFINQAATNEQQTDKKEKESWEREDTLATLETFQHPKPRPALSREYTTEESFFFNRPSSQWRSTRNDSNDISVKNNDCKPIIVKECSNGAPTSRIETSGPKRNKDRYSRKKSIIESGSNIVRFLKHRFYDFLTLKAVSVIIPLVIVSLTSFFVYYAVKLEPDNKQLMIYKYSHNYGKASVMHYYSFQRNFEEEYTSVYLVWGLRPNDMSPCDLKSTQKYCTGTNSYDSSFDASSTDVQSALKSLCQSLEAMTDEEADLYKIKVNPATNKREIQCFTTAMEDYIEKDVQANYALLANTTISIPYDRTNVTRFMLAKPHIYNVSAVPSTFDGYLEIAVAYWLSNGYTAKPREDFFLYDHLLGEERIPGTSQRALNTYYELYYATKMKYVAVQINTTLSVFTLGYIDGKPIQERWEKYMQDQIAGMPPTMKNGFQVTKNTWHWIKVQETLTQSAIQGVTIGLSLALVILILTTMNVVIGVISTLVIALVTACVIGMIPLAGWKLGVLESLNLCMVVGLSVDYIVHMAEAYTTAPSETRKGRTRHMLETMGMSVISGAVTTFGASVFLLFSQIQFLFQFGIFVMCIISTSLLFSLFGFPTCLALFGPEGTTGSLAELFRKLKRCCCRKESF